MRKKIHAKVRKDDADAFITEADQAVGTPDDLAQHLAEEFLRSAAGGEETEEDSRDEVLAEEMGGPFIESGPEEEFGSTLDRGVREPGARTMAARGLGQGPSGRDDDDDSDEVEPSALPTVVGSLAIAGADELEESSEEDADAEVSDRVAGYDGRQRSLLLVDVEPASRVEPPSILPYKG
jgi:hypothetical protein